MNTAYRSVVFAGRRPMTLRYGISDSLAGEVGLTCGGRVTIFLHLLSDQAAAVEREVVAGIGRGASTALATLLDGERAGAKLALIDGEVIGSIGPAARFDEAITEGAAGVVGSGAEVRRFGVDGNLSEDTVAVHLHAAAPPPQGTHLRRGRFLRGARPARPRARVPVTICDPREPFLRSPRFDAAAKIRSVWPDEAFDAISLGPP
jgi:xanthine dehydrogenase accessory factor